MIFYVLCGMLSVFVPWVGVPIIAISLIASLIMLISGAFDEETCYSSNAMCLTLISSIIVGAIFEPLAIVPMSIFGIYTIVSFIEDVAYIPFFLIPIYYFWIDVKGIFKCVALIFVIAITLLQVAVTVGCIIIFPLALSGLYFSWDDLLIFDFINENFD